MPPSRMTPVALWLGCALLCAPVSSLRAPAVPRARGPSAIYQPAPGHPNLGQIALNLEPFDLSMPEFGALARPRPAPHALIASGAGLNATARVFDLAARRRRETVRFRSLAPVTSVFSVLFSALLLFFKRRKRHPRRACVFVELPTENPTRAVESDLNATVGDLVARVLRQSGMLQVDAYLECGGRVCDEARTLRKCGIGHNSSVSLRLRARGGARQQPETDPGNNKLIRKMRAEIEQKDATIETQKNAIVCLQDELNKRRPHEPLQMGPTGLNSRRLSQKRPREHVNASDDDDYVRHMTAVLTNAWRAWRFHMLTGTLTKEHVQNAPDEVQAAADEIGHDAYVFKKIEVLEQLNLVGEHLEMSRYAMNEVIELMKHSKFRVADFDEWFVLPRECYVNFKECAINLAAEAVDKALPADSRRPTPRLQLPPPLLQQPSPPSPSDSDAPSTPSTPTTESSPHPKRPRSTASTSREHGTRQTGNGKRKQSGSGSGSSKRGRGRGVAVNDEINAVASSDASATNARDVRVSRRAASKESDGECGQREEGEVEAGSSAKDQTEEPVEAADADGPDWKTRMIEGISCNGLPTIGATASPLKVRQKMEEMLKQTPNTIVHVTGFTPDTFEKLSVPDERSRGMASKYIRALAGQVKNGTMWSPLHHLQQPKAGSTKYFWMVYTEDWLSELQRVAEMTNASTLDSELRSSQYQVSVENVVAARLKAMRDAGLDHCPTCTQPIQNPHDPDFERKMHIVCCLAQSDVRPCACDFALTTGA